MNETIWHVGERVVKKPYTCTCNTQYPVAFLQFELMVEKEIRNEIKTLIHFVILRIRTAAAFSTCFTHKRNECVFRWFH